MENAADDYIKYLENQIRLLQTKFVPDNFFYNLDINARLLTLQDSLLKFKSLFHI